MTSILKQTEPKSFIRNQVPDNLEDLLSRLRKKVKEERIRIGEFLRQFDKLRSGTISKDQLRVGLNMSKIVLSEAEFNILVEAFACEDKPNYVRVKDFIDSIDQVFTKKQLQKSSPKQFFEPASTLYRYGKQGPTQEELTLAEQAKERFKEFSRCNRLDIKQFFQDWDKLHRNKISPKQFRQVLAMNYFDLSQEEFRVLSKVYGTQEGDIKYVDFLNDTKPWDFDYLNQSKQEWKHGTGRPRQIPETIKGILQQLRKLTKVNRVRHKQYIQDFDPLRKGLVTKNKFVGVIFQTMKLNLDERILKALQSYYQDPNDSKMVRYLDFLDDVDIVFTLPERQKQPLITPPVFDYSCTKSGFNQNSDEAEFQRLMNRLGQVVRKHRLLLKPHFQDKDIAKSGKVLFTRMRAILDYNKLPLTDRQYKLLCDRFNHENIEFNYTEFIQLLNKYEQIN